MLGFCGVGTIGIAAVVAVFALSHFAAEAALIARSKDHAQPAQSKDRAAKTAESKDRRVPLAGSKSRGAQPVQTKERKDLRVSPPGMTEQPVGCPAPV